MPDKPHTKAIDQKEFELPETYYVRDIEDRVFQAVVAQCVAKVDGLTLVEGKFLENIFGRDHHDHLGAIRVDQDSRSHSVDIRLDVGIEYGCSIPDKAEELQSLIAQEVTGTTGLHVGTVHVLFKSLLPDKAQQKKRQHQEKVRVKMGELEKQEPSYTEDFG